MTHLDPHAGKFKAVIPKGFYRPRSPDTCKHCPVCRNVEFSLVNRKHHCKFCGILSCDKCCSARIVMGKDEHRSCRKCFAEHSGVPEVQDLNNRGVFFFGRVVAYRMTNVALKPYSAEQLKRINDLQELYRELYQRDSPELKLHMQFDRMAHVRALDECTVPHPGENVLTPVVNGIFSIVECYIAAFTSKVFCNESAPEMLWVRMLCNKVRELLKFAVGRNFAKQSAANIADQTVPATGAAAAPAQVAAAVSEAEEPTTPRPPAQISSGEVEIRLLVDLIDREKAKGVISDDAAFFGEETYRWAADAMREQLLVASATLAAQLDDHCLGDILTSVVDHGRTFLNEYFECLVKTVDPGAQTITVITILNPTPTKLFSEWLKKHPSVSRLLTSPCCTASFASLFSCAAPPLPSMMILEGADSDAATVQSDLQKLWKSTQPGSAVCGATLLQEIARSMTVFTELLVCVRDAAYIASLVGELSMSRSPPAKVVVGALIRGVASVRTQLLDCRKQLQDLLPGGGSTLHSLLSQLDALRRTGDAMRDEGKRAMALFQEGNAARRQATAKRRLQELLQSVARVASAVPELNSMSDGGASEVSILRSLFESESRPRGTDQRLIPHLVQQSPAGNVNVTPLATPQLSLSAAPVCLVRASSLALDVVVALANGDCCYIGHGGAAGPQLVRTLLTRDDGAVENINWFDAGAGAATNHVLFTFSRKAKVTTMTFFDADFTRRKSVEHMEVIQTFTFHGEDGARTSRYVTELYGDGRVLHINAKYLDGCVQHSGNLPYILDTASCPLWGAWWAKYKLRICHFVAVEEEATGVCTKLLFSFALLGSSPGGMVAVWSFDAPGSWLCRQVVLSAAPTTSFSTRNCMQCALSRRSSCVAMVLNDAKGVIVSYAVGTATEVQYSNNSTAPSNHAEINFHDVFSCGSSFVATDKNRTAVLLVESNALARSSRAFSVPLSSLVPLLPDSIKGLVVVTETSTLQFDPVRLVAENQVFDATAHSNVTPGELEPLPTTTERPMPKFSRRVAVAGTACNGCKATTAIDNCLYCNQFFCDDCAHNQVIEGKKVKICGACVHAVNGRSLPFEWHDKTWGK